MLKAEMIRSEDASVYPVCVETKKVLKSYNFFLYENENSLVLIDAGNDDEESWEKLNEVLSTYDFTIQDIDLILLTHHHNDHTGLVNWILEVKEIPVYAHPEATKRLKMEPSFFKGRLAFFEQLYKEMGCGELSENQLEKMRKSVLHPKDKAMKGNITKIVAGDEIAGLRAIAAPGHAPNQLMFYDEKRKWLFVGDLVIKHISTNALIEPDEDFKRIPTLVQHVESLKRCHELDVDVLFSGHGELVYEHEEIVSKWLEKIEGKSEKFLKVIESGVETANDLAQSVYKKKYASQFGLVISEIIGHVDYLEHKGKITKKKVDGVWHYEALE